MIKITLSFAIFVTLIRQTKKNIIITESNNGYFTTYQCWTNL